MNYRALEDLVNILVKKTGYKLSDLKLEEDIDLLEERKKDLEEELSTLKDNYKQFAQNIYQAKILTFIIQSNFANVKSFP